MGAEHCRNFWQIERHQPGAGNIEGRCTTGRNGADWQTRTVRHFEEQGLERREALRRMLEQYASYMDENLPVHTWPVP